MLNLVKIIPYFVYHINYFILEISYFKGYLANLRVRNVGGDLRHDDQGSAPLGPPHPQQGPPLPELVPRLLDVGIQEGVGDHHRWGKTVTPTCP